MRQGTPKRVEILDDVISNQIAAGEVVERPYHAIKELIENAIDAYANHISISIEEGGLKSIKILDDGHGMEEGDACNAIQKHGTSKLKKIEDLNNIMTLGFRGEALPSIAAISKFSLKTRTAKQNHAIKITLEGGKNLDKQYAAGNIGTEIEVKDLYFNVPARRSFQKPPKAEAEAIKELVIQQALCYPEIAFKLIIDDREALNLPIQTHLKNRINSLFGRRLLDYLHPIEYQGEFQLKGYISNQHHLYSSHRHAYTYVNDRLVKSQFFWTMIETAFRTKLPKGKYPFYVLKLQISPYLVDVNIHPNKTEVRFSNENRIREILLSLLTELAKGFPELPTEVMTLEPSIEPSLIEEEKNNIEYSTEVSFFPKGDQRISNDREEKPKDQEHISDKDLFIYQPKPISTNPTSFPIISPYLQQASQIPASQIPASQIPASQIPASQAQFPIYSQINRNLPFTPASIMPTQRNDETTNQATLKAVRNQDSVQALQQGLPFPISANQGTDLSSSAVTGLASHFDQDQPNIPIHSRTSLQQASLENKQKTLNISEDSYSVQGNFLQPEKHFTQYVNPHQPSITEQGQWVLNRPLGKIDELKLSFKNISAFKQIGVIHERWWQLEGEDGFALIDLGMVRTLFCMKKQKYQPITPILLELPQGLLSKLQHRQQILKGLGLDIKKQMDAYLVEQVSYPQYLPLQAIPSLVQSYLQIDQLLQAKEKFIGMMAELPITAHQRVELIKQLLMVDEIFYEDASLRNHFKLTSVFKYIDLVRGDR